MSMYEKYYLDFAIVTKLTLKLTNQFEKCCFTLSIVDTVNNFWFRLYGYTE